MSELGTNALCYAARGEENGAFQVALAPATDAGGDTVPKIEDAEKEALCGRGLDIVSSPAHNVGIPGAGQGFTVTAELISYHPSSRPWR